MTLDPRSAVRSAVRRAGRRSSRPVRSSPTVGASVMMLALAVPSAVEAQPALSVSAGAASYDLSGVGTSGIGAVRVEWPLAAGLAVQAGSGFFWYDTQGDDQVAMLLPETALLARVPGPVPLLVIAGVGHTVGVKGRLDDELTLHAALALDLEDRGGWAVRPEIRVRVVDPWVGTIGDFTIGVRRRFGEP